MHSLIIDFFSQLNIIDWAIIGIVIFSVAISLFRGFTVELLSVLIWIIALMASISLVEAVEPVLRQWIDVESVRYLIAFSSVFIIILLVGKLLALVLKKLLYSTGLSFLDRVLGMAFGAVRGVIVVLGLVLLAQKIGLDQEALWQTSVLIPHAEIISVWLLDSFSGLM